MGVQHAGLLVHRAAGARPAVQDVVLPREANVFLDIWTLQPHGIPHCHETGINHRTKIRVGVETPFKPLIKKGYKTKPGDGHRKKNNVFGLTYYKRERKGLKLKTQSRNI